jgi:hypothetical protein
VLVPPFGGARGLGERRKAALALLVENGGRERVLRFYITAVGYANVQHGGVRREDERTKLQKR